jgi:hypothetical protein
MGNRATDFPLPNPTQANPASIAQTLGDADEEGSLLWLALELGWLNHVGVAAESPNEAAYAFFHPTFENILRLVRLRLALFL